MAGDKEDRLHGFGHRDSGFDGTTVLTIYICLLFAIPSPMVVAPLGSAGAPSAIMAFGAFFLWAWFKLQRADSPIGASLVRSVALSWLLIMLVIYAHAVSRPIPADEISPADNGLLKVIGLTGILLVACDGISSLERHRAVLRRLVIAGGVVAALGILQYATKQLFVDRLVIPGLTSGASEWTLALRSGLARPSGTSTHPIEFGVILTMIFPLCITFAMKAPRRRLMYSLILGAVSFAIFLSISRSAILCAAVALLVLGASWNGVTRIRALVIFLILSATVYLTVPGVLGTVTRLFTGASDDPSISSRTASYDVAADFFQISPWLGRGFGTFLPKYWILDNGYLGLLIEAGLVGLTGMLCLVVAALVSAWQSKRLVDDEFDRAIAQALIAAIAAGASGLAFFDTFGFPQSAGCFFLLLGMAGAMRRLAADSVGISHLNQVAAADNHPQESEAVATRRQDRGASS